MKKALRILLVGVVAVALIVAIGVTLVGSNINRIVKAVVQDVGTRITGTAVTLDRTDISLRQGSGSLFELSIANPATFSASNAFELDEITVNLEITSLGSDEIVLERVVVDGAQINLEEVDGRTNLQELLDHMQQYAGGEGTESAEADTPKLVIKEFRFTNATATLASARLSKNVTVPIPELVLTDIGRKGTGVTAAEAGKQILQPLIKKALEGSQRGGLDQLKTKAIDRLGGLLRGKDEPPPAQ